MDEHQKKSSDTVSRRTDNAMAKRKRKKGQTTIYKTLPIKQNSNSWDVLLNDKQKPKVPNTKWIHIA